MTKTGHLPWTFLYDFILQQCSSVNKLVYSHQDGNDNEALFVSPQWRSNLCVAQAEKGAGGQECSSALWFLHRQSCCGQCFPLLFIVCDRSARENFASRSSAIEHGLEREWQRKQSNNKLGVKWGVRQACLGGREWLSEREGELSGQTCESL